MNYRNMSMDELAGVLQVETNHKKFINASKAFVTKYLQASLLTEEDVTDRLKQAEQIGYERGVADTEDQVAHKLERISDLVSLDLP